MKRLVELLQQQGSVFKSLEPIAPKSLGSRKKIELYLGVDTAGYYALVAYLAKKSRVLTKEAEAIEGLFTAAQERLGATIPQKIILIDAPLCSKAKAWLEAHGWQVRHLV